MEITKEQRDALRLEWAEALESGKYEQCQDTLAFGDTFCCLGVAFELVKKFGSQNNLVIGGDEYAGVRKFVGITDAGENAFVKANDEDNKSFAEIAKIVRNPPPGTFID